MALPAPRSRQPPRRTGPTSTTTSSPTSAPIPLDTILPSTVQAWVTHAMDGGLSPRSVRKYHTLLHGIFARAVRDRILLANPAAHTELPKVINRRMRILTPDEFDRLLSHVPVEHRAMVLLAAETGLRWGELVALRPHHLDPRTATLTVQDVYVEVSKKNSPTGQRMILRHYPKDNEPRTLRITSPARHRPRRPDHGSGHRAGSAAVRQPSRTAHLPLHLPRPHLATRRQSHRTRLPPTLARPAPHQCLLAPRRRSRPQNSHGPPRPHPAHHHPAIPPHPAQHRRHRPRSSSQSPRNGHLRLRRVRSKAAGHSRLILSRRGSHGSPSEVAFWRGPHIGSGIRCPTLTFKFCATFYVRLMPGRPLDAVPRHHVVGRPESTRPCVSRTERR